METKIQIKSIWGNVLFEYEKENNTPKEIIEKAVGEGTILNRLILDGIILYKIILNKLILEGEILLK